MAGAGLARAEPSTASRSGAPACCGGSGLAGETQAGGSPGAFTRNKVGYVPERGAAAGA